MGYNMSSLQIMHKTQHISIQCQVPRTHRMRQSKKITYANNSAASHGQPGRTYSLTALKQSIKQEEDPKSGLALLKDYELHHFLF